MRKSYVARGIVKYQGKYLMLKKAKCDYKSNIGKWETPGGRIEPNEDPKNTIIREIKEETNLYCELLVKLPILYFKNEELNSTAHVFVLKSNSNKVKLSDEHSEYKWCTFDEVKTLDTVFTEHLLKNLALAEKIK